MQLEGLKGHGLGRYKESGSVIPYHLYSTHQCPITPIYCLLHFDVVTSSLHDDIQHMCMTSGIDLDVPLQIYINLNQNADTDYVAVYKWNLWKKTQRELMINLNLGST